MVKRLLLAVALAVGVVGVVGLTQTSSASATVNWDDCKPVVVEDNVREKNTWKPKCVTPAEPTMVDLCGKENDTYTIPETKGVYYKVNGNYKAAGTYDAPMYGYRTVHVQAKALPSYKIDGEDYWKLEFTDVECKPMLSYTADCDVATQSFVVTVSNTGDADGVFSLNGTEYTVAPASSETASVYTGSEGADITLVVNNVTVLDNKRYVCIQGQGATGTKVSTPKEVVSLPVTADNTALAASAVVGVLVAATAGGYALHRRNAFSA